MRDRQTSHEPVPTDTRWSDAEVVRAFEDSATFGAVARVIHVVAESAPESRVVQMAARPWHVWRHQPAADLARSSGLLLLAASATAVTMAMWHRPVAGWLWLVPPTVAAASGLLMIAAPYRGTKGRG